MEAPLLNVDEVEVIVPPLDFVPDLRRHDDTPIVTVGYAGVRWTFYTGRHLGDRVDVVNEGTDWAEACTMDLIDTPFKMLHIHSASSISRAFVPDELLPYIEALLKLHA